MIDKASMHGRTLQPLEVTEFAAEVLQEAIEWHLGRLQKAMNAERDCANRTGWALQERRRWALHIVMRDLSWKREELGLMLPVHAEALARDIERTAYRMPRSAANAEALKAERAARVDAERVRKAGSRVESARNKRITGKAKEP